MSSRYILYLHLFRIFILFLLFGVIMYYLNEDWRLYCHEKYGTFEKLFDTRRSYEVFVPEEDLKPPMGMREYYDRRVELQNKYTLRSKVKFAAQKDHVGSPLWDGFNADLPPDTKWSNGRIIYVPEEYQQMVAQSQKEFPDYEKQLRIIEDM